MSQYDCDHLYSLTDCKWPKCEHPKECHPRELPHRVVKRDNEYKNGILITCSCGAEWSHPAEATEEKIASIFESHIAYSKRMAMKVD